MARWATGTLLIAVALSSSAYFATASSSSETAPQLDVVGFLAQSWTLTVTDSSGNYTVGLNLVRSVHFSDVLTGELSLPGITQTPLSLRVDRAGRNTSITVTVTAAASEDSDNNEGDTAKPLVIAGVNARQSLRKSWIATGAVTLGSSKASFTLQLIGESSLHLALQLESGETIVAVGAGDFAPPAPSFWLRWGPSAVMFAVFTVTRAFSAFVEARQEKKAVMTKTLRAAAAASAKK
jgi:hypothetical protein